MKKRIGSYHLSFKTMLLLVLLMGGNANIFAAEQPPQAKPQTQGQPPVGEDPGPIYTQMILQWAKETNFAQNAAEVIVAKFKLDMENNPKMKAAMTPELIADLEQFFYELFLSPETIKDLAALYAQYFTLDDLQDLIKFYKSPVGQKLIKNDPAIKIGTQHIGEALLKRHEKEYMGVIAKHLVPQKKNDETKTPHANNTTHFNIKVKDKKKLNVSSNDHPPLKLKKKVRVATEDLNQFILYGTDDWSTHFPLYTTVQATTP